MFCAAVLVQQKKYHACGFYMVLTCDVSAIGWFMTMFRARACVYIIGTITAMHFHGGSHAVTASEDGAICVWQVQGWICLKVMRGHKYV